MIKINRQNAEDRIWIAVEDNDQFENSGRTLYGGPRYKGLGLYEPQDSFELDQIQGGSYFIYSYETLIAWRDEFGAWVFNETRYSVTTSGHQNMVKASLAKLEDFVLA